MLFGKYDFKCEMEGEAVLPYYKGSTFRGLFGHALKRVVCVLKRQPCETCPLKTRCLYVTVFETALAMRMPSGSKISTPPHPFVIEPPLTPQREFEKGETFECALLLFGEINSQLPYFVYAFEEMGRIGIGKRVQGQRARFRLKDVRNGGTVLYSADSGSLRQTHPPDSLELDSGSPRGMGGGRALTRVRVGLETPLRLKFKNRLNRADLPFHVLVRAMLRRVSALFNAWNGGEPELDYRGIVSRAEEVRVVENDLSWFDWQRYSNRHERKMLMGGMVGSIVCRASRRRYPIKPAWREKIHTSHP